MVISIDVVYLLMPDAGKCEMDREPTLVMRLDREPTLLMRTGRLQTSGLSPQCGKR